MINKRLTIRKAFTLAEVLITLGIIGVVAAMTIPTLITNTRSSQYRSKFKKTISTLSQAARMSQAQYGFDYAGINAICSKDGGKEHPENVMSVCSILNGTLSGYTYYANATDIKMNKNGKITNYTITPGYFINTDPGARNLNQLQAYVLNDGTIVAISKLMGNALGKCSLSIGKVIEDTTSGEVQHCIGFIDVNGISLPNKEVSCSSGSNSLAQRDCIVKNDAEHMTDIYPIRFHDGIVEPASAAARYILKSAK